MNPDPWPAYPFCRCGHHIDDHDDITNRCDSCRCWEYIAEETR